MGLVQPNGEAFWTLRLLKLPSEAWDGRLGAVFDDLPIDDAEDGNACDRYWLSGSDALVDTLMCTTSDPSAAVPPAAARRREPVVRQARRNDRHWPAGQREAPARRSTVRLAPAPCRPLRSRRDLGPALRSARAAAPRIRPAARPPTPGAVPTPDGSRLWRPVAGTTRPRSGRLQITKDSRPDAGGLIVPCADGDAATTCWISSDV
jgi:hypothetical protein